MGTTPIFCLDLLVGSETVHRFALYAGDQSVGRSRDCAIQLPDATVSAHHAVLSVVENPELACFCELRITDLGSTNGTWINGQRTEAGRAVIGDVLGFGNTQLRVTSGDSGDGSLTSLDPLLS